MIDDEDRSPTPEPPKKGIFNLLATNPVTLNPGKKTFHWTSSIQIVLDLDQLAKQKEGKTHTQDEARRMYSSR